MRDGVQRFRDGAWRTVKLRFEILHWFYWWFWPPIDMMEYQCWFQEHWCALLSGQPFLLQTLREGRGLIVIGESPTGPEKGGAQGDMSPASPLQLRPPWRNYGLPGDAEALPDYRLFKLALYTEDTGYSDLVMNWYDPLGHVLLIREDMDFLAHLDALAMPR